MSRHYHLPHIVNFQKADGIFFITTCTFDRKPILNNPNVAKILVEEWRSAEERHGWLIGRYVIMPDHVHFFCSVNIQPENFHPKELSSFLQYWKQWTSKRMIRELNLEIEKYSPPIWQAEFFDHLLRSTESYSQKWEYVRQNPVRKQLVTCPDEWPWQGEISDLW